MMFPPKKYDSIIFALVVLFLSYCCCGYSSFIVALDHDSNSNIFLQQEKSDDSEIATTFLRRRELVVDNDNEAQAIGGDVVIVEKNGVDERDLMALALSSNNRCGCSTCSEEVLNSNADGYSCGARIDWMVGTMDYSEEDACNLVGGIEFDVVCGGCHSAQCDEPVSFRCGCSKCTENVWNTLATDDGGTYTCGGRISWMESSGQFDEAGSCRFVTKEFPDICTCTCNDDDDEVDNYDITSAPTLDPMTMKPTTSPTQTPTTKPPTKSPIKEQEPLTTPEKCGCTSCTDSVLNSIANGATCRGRIDWVIANDGLSEADSCKLVADEYPQICGLCHAEHCGSFPPTPTPVLSGMVKVMSYNTEYTGYYDGRISSFAAKIAEVAADVVGLQECQDANTLAAQAGYTLLTATGAQNYILYNANRLQQLDSGSMNIPRDDYAQRALTWGRFRILEGSGVGNEFWFFNTHLPHRHNEAGDPNTHARIGRMLLAKRIELGAKNSPTIVVGDCNPFASAGAPEGSFESNLADGGIAKIYEATGNNGGYAGLDKIFASTDDWTGSGADVGTGRSDHPAIAADLTLLNRG